MVNLAVWLFALIVPLVKKVLIALGIGIASYAGLTVLANQVQTAVVANYGMLGDTTLQILALGGISQSVGIILSAFSAKIAMMAVGRFTKIAA